MKTFKFKTNINCNGCVNAVTPLLSKIDNIRSWQVDIDDPYKILSVDTEDQSDELIRKAVLKAGFEIERFN